HEVFQDIPTVFYPSSQKLRQLGIKAPRGKRKHSQRKGLADKAIREAIKDQEIICSGVHVTIPEESIQKDIKKYDDIADSLVISVSAAKKIVPIIRLLERNQRTSEYKVHTASMPEGNPVVVAGSAEAEAEAETEAEAEAWISVYLLSGLL
ncbi:MAG: hypothetical protein H7842_14970, partial [Gammaproteobacteria bacterium SHHR-1]